MCFSCKNCSIKMNCMIYLQNKVFKYTNPLIRKIQILTIIILFFFQ